jgi:acyl-coenzyme A thioesterase PaaI-like protein
MTVGQAFQDTIAENHCWGCGTLNPHGLRIKSHWAGDASDEAICNWQPWAEHMAGPTHILNGGIIAALIDCHCVCTAMAAAYRAEGLPLEGEPRLWYVTGSLQVTHLRPTPIAAPVKLRAPVLAMAERKTQLICTLYSGDEACSRGEVVAVRVPPDWRAAPA